MPDHERNVLMWIAGGIARSWPSIAGWTIDILMVGVIGYIIFAILGCSPTLATPLHANEVTIIRQSHCHAKHQGTEVKVEFSKNTRRVQCSGQPNETCDAVGWALLPGNTVVYWSKWVQEQTDDANLNIVAAHEVCHVSRMSWNEVTTDWCATKSYRESGCS